MAPIEAGINSSVIDRIKKISEQSEDNYAHAQLLAIKDFFNEIIPPILAQRYDKVYIANDRVPRFLQVGSDVYPIKYLSLTRKDALHVPYLILSDGSLHHVFIDPDQLRLSIWSIPDRVERTYPISQEFENSQSNNSLIFIRDPQNKFRLQQPLLGPEGIKPSTHFYGNTLLWEIRPESLDSNSDPQETVKDSLSYLFTLSLATHRNDSYSQPH